MRPIIFAKKNVLPMFLGMYEINLYSVKNNEERAMGPSSISSKGPDPLSLLLYIIVALLKQFASSKKFEVAYC